MAAAAALLFLPASIDAQEPLPEMGSLDPGSVTVSGISSGGFFAHQFHIAYSDLIDGAGVIAGGPYACADQIPNAFALLPFASVVVATSTCSHIARTPFSLLSPAPSVDRSVADTLDEHRRGTIDDPANLANDRVWLFTGRRDDIVPTSTMEVLRTYYETLGVAGSAMRFVSNPDANHGMPVEEFEVACGDHEPPFLIDCDFDASRRLLAHLYAGTAGAAPVDAIPQNLRSFNQTEFFDAGRKSASLAETGFFYVPSACDDSSGATCRLHVAFHGCRQFAGAIDDDFYAGAGYNGFAEANRIVVLYPQTTDFVRVTDPLGFTGNPNGCWDWWGYSGPDYFRQSGAQMQAVKAMIDRLLPD